MVIVVLRTNLQWLREDTATSIMEVCIIPIYDHHKDRQVACSLVLEEVVGFLQEETEHLACIHRRRRRRCHHLIPSSSQHSDDNPPHHRSNLLVNSNTINNDHPNSHSTTPVVGILAFQQDLNLVVDVDQWEDVVDAVAGLDVAEE